MSQFTTPADLRMLDDYCWEVLSPFEYHVGELGSGEVITVPAGSVTDLATVPRALWSIFPPHGRYAKAAIIHDYLYDQAIKNKRYADGVLLEAMEVLQVPRWRRYIMYWAARLAGRGNYLKHINLSANRHIPWQRKCNLLWVLFDNEDDGTAPEWYEPGRPLWQRRIMWWFRNPAHNLMFYVLGVTDRDRVLISLHGTDVHPPEGGWLWCVSYVGRLRLPFLSYEGKRIKAYIGWRPAGAFGLKFNLKTL